jgi:hypothetical protein
LALDLYPQILNHVEKACNGQTLLVAEAYRIHVTIFAFTNI